MCYITFVVDVKHLPLATLPDGDVKRETEYLAYHEGSQCD